MATRDNARGTRPGDRARSAKAGCPPERGVVPARVRRRQKTARASVKKDTMLLQAPRGPRVRWAVTKPKVKKG
jgi:hypothetical protein